MSVIDKIDMILDEGNKKIMIKKKGSGYESWTYHMKGATRGGRDRSHSPIKMQDFNSVADAEKWAKKNGWNVSLVEAYSSNKAKHRYDDRALEHISNSLTDKEWFVLSLVIGMKPVARKKELERAVRSYNVPMDMDEYPTIVNSLISKKALGTGGRMAPQTRDVWNVKFPDTIASQTHQVVPKLKF